MTPTYNLPIDDELLAAYLDGRLEGEQEEYVENAIENSPELQWAVDRWIEMQVNHDNGASADNIIGINVAKIDPKPRNRFVYWAASILLLVGISLPLFFNSGRINPESGMPSGFPVSEKTPMEYTIIPDGSSHDDATQMVEDDKDFSYDIAYYKSALIVMWGQRLDSAKFVLYNSQGISLFHSYVGNGSADVIGLSAIDDSYKPRWLSMKFYNPGFYCADSVMINY